MLSEVLCNGVVWLRVDRFCKYAVLFKIKNCINITKKLVFMSLIK